jgi:aminoglycoside phosphotransferase (APT) family kinase protein
VPSSHPFASIERLFARHGLGPVTSAEPLSGGQLNAVVCVNGTHVLRWRERAQATGSLKREQTVLSRLRGRVPVPELVASGLDDLLGEYVIQTWVPGRTLLSAWLDNPDVATREWWLQQWTAALRAIHEERFLHPGELIDGRLKESSTWRSYVEGRIRKRLDLLMRVPAMDREFILAAERYLRRQGSVLEDGPFCLIHRDMHFGNVVVDGPHLTGILDFELAEVGPPDYELDTLYRFLTWPAAFGEPGQASQLTPARFASVWVRLKRGYPELFAVRNLRERLALYALDYHLSCLIQAYSGRWAGESSVEPIFRGLSEILNGRYGPA